MANTHLDVRENIDNNRFCVILIRGLEHINDMVGTEISKILGLEVFNSDWYDEHEDLSHKLARLHTQVQEIKKSGKEVIVIGVSAGAGLTVSYMLRYPNTIHSLYSILGVLSPDQHDPKIIYLNTKSKSFQEMTSEVSQNLTPETIQAGHLDTKIIAYGSLGDTVVPLQTELPDWVKTKQIVGEQNHVQTIIEIMLYALYKQVSTHTSLVEELRS